MKNIKAQEILLAHPEFNKPLEIHTDASHTQLESVVLQNNKPIAFYSRKLNLAQTQYTTTEKELPSMVETRKEFRNILLDQQAVVYTRSPKISPARPSLLKGSGGGGCHWKKYSPEIQYTPEESNIVADALSRHDLTNKEHYEQMSIEQIAEPYADKAKDQPATYLLSYADIANAQKEVQSWKDLW